jgi:NADPH2:quinone reductase
MRKVVVHAGRGPEALRLTIAPQPVPDIGQLLVLVEAIGVNYRDVRQRRGDYGRGHGIHGEGAGTVVAVGADVHDFAVGDRVAWIAAVDSYAELIVLDANRAVPVPANLSTDIAAAALLQGITAHYLSMSTAPVAPDVDVLVHAGSGGVGSLLIQMVKHRGTRVVATTSNRQKDWLAREAGADTVVAYTGFADRVLEITDGSGVAVVYDGVGRDTLDGSLRSLQTRGWMVIFGAASGEPEPVDTRRLFERSLVLTRVSVMHFTSSSRELVTRANAVFNLIVQGSLRVHVGARYPLAEAARAHADLESRATVGKLLLIP